jgi:hypothetical protein
MTKKAYDTRPKLSTKRKAHRRSGYYRSDGTYVRPHSVRESSVFYIEDRGKPGRTPKEERWYDPQEQLGFIDDKGHTHGWHAGDLVKKRHWVLNQLAKKRGYNKVIKELNALANVTTYSYVEEAARSDMQYLQRRRDKK